jgi:hypothetical protein
MTPVEQMIALSEAMGKVSNSTERLGLLSAFGGDQFQWLNTLLNQGPDGIRRLMAEAGAVGRTVGSEQAEQAKLVNAAWTRATTAVKSAVLSVGAAFLPQADVSASVSETVVDLAGQVRGFIDENRGLVLGVAAAGAVLLAGGAAMYGFGTAVSAAGAMIGGLATAASVAAGAVGLLATPLRLVTAAVVGLGVAFFTLTDAGREMAASIGTAFGETADRAVTGWAAIKNAIQAGDLRLAGRVAIAGLEVEFRRAMVALTNGT